MEVVVTTFTNPFSFYCVANSHANEIVCLADNTDENLISRSKFAASDVNHGQYIAVMWKNKWTRGIVSIENQFLIWLVDYGIFLCPNNDTVYIDLPEEYRKYPSKVFEASIHGVTPVDKVLGDLYLEMSDNRIINLVDELETWPVFLEQNKEAFIENLSTFYVSRRKHRACILKPDFIDMTLPVMTLQTSLNEYTAICTKSMQLNKELQKCDGSSEDGSTVLDLKCYYVKEEKAYKLTHSEIIKYADMYVNIHGQKYNLLNVLKNKIRDLNICERYKDHDLKSLGCGISKRRSKD